MPTKQKINGSKPWYFQTWNNESQDRKRYSPASWPSNGSQQAPRTAWQLWPQRTHRQQAWPTMEGFAFCLRDMSNICPYVFPPGFIAPIKVPDAVGVQTAGRQEVFLHPTTNVTLCWLKHAQTQGSGLAKDICNAAKNWAGDGDTGAERYSPCSVPSAREHHTSQRFQQWLRYQ